MFDLAASFAPSQSYMVGVVIELVALSFFFLFHSLPLCLLLHPLVVVVVSYRQQFFFLSFSINVGYIFKGGL